jgi:hypothetical protein
MLILDAAKAGAGIGTSPSSALPTLRMQPFSFFRRFNPSPCTLHPTA